MKVKLVLNQCVSNLSGLLNWWPGEGNATDVQGSANGTINGGVTFTPGISGQAFSFNGTNSFVALPDNFFPFPASGTGTAPFSFSTWFKTTQSGVIFGQQNGTPFVSVAGNVAGLYVGTDGKLYAEMFWAGSLSQVVSAAAVNNGQFHHVTVTYDGTNQTVYLDGVQIGSHAFTETAYSSSGYKYQLGTGNTVGGWPNGNNSWFTFNGVLDEPMVFNRALSASEAAGVFTCGQGGAQNQPPVVNPGPNQTITLPTNTVTLNGTVTDDGLPVGGHLVIQWSQVSGPAGVAFSSPSTAATQATLPGTGTYVLQLSGNDGALTTTAHVTVQVLPSGQSSGVSVQIVTPVDGSVITTRTPVTANITGGNWTLAYALNGDDGATTLQFITIATGTGAVSNASIGTFDPTLLLNGAYVIRLTSIDSLGNPAVDQVGVVVRGQQKIGNFTLSFNDLTIPVAGLPITIVRTYDSRDKRVGDFGVGWTLSLTNVRVEKTGIIGKLWDETVTNDLIPQYCLQPTHAKYVTITFPDGKQYKFQAVTSPGCQQAAPITGGNIVYQQVVTDSGTGGATLAAVGDTSFQIDGPVPGLVNLIGVGGQQIQNPTQFQMRTAEGYTYNLDEKLGVTSLIDPNGNSLTFTYNGIIHSSGKSVAFTRDSQGRITKITDPMGNVMSYNINPAGDLVGFTDAVGNTSTFSYNATHGLLTITDPRGITPVTNNYDANGRLISTTDANGKTITFTHDLATNHETITDRLGNPTIYEYDQDGNVTRMTDALSHVTTYTYDSHDNQLTETNALNNTTTYTFDAVDNQTSITDPLGNTKTFTYNSFRKVVTAAYPNGGVATNVFDTKGNLTSVKDPIGNTTALNYGTSGLLTSITDAAGGLTSISYDALGNVSSVTDAAGSITRFSYDANCRAISNTKTRTDGGALLTLTSMFQYDGTGHLTQTTHPDGTTTQTSYNQIGKQGRTVDELGRQTLYQYDSTGRLTSLTSPDGTTQSWSYDADGRRITASDQAGRVTMYSYDAVGRLISTTYPDGSSQTKSYDGAGRTIATTGANGGTTSYSYDKAGRRTTLTNPVGQVTTFTYDAHGNELTIIDALGNTTSFQYDKINRRTAVVYPDGTTSRTGYDQLNRVTSRVDQAGRQTLYAYDQDGRLTSVNDALGHVTAFAYDEVGDKISETDALGRVTTFRYDKLGRRLSRSLPLGMSEAYSYDAAGNLSTRRDFNGKTTSFSYDSMNRLLSITPDSSFNAPATTFAYTVTGSRASMTDISGATTYTYDSRDRVLVKATPEGTLSYSYDASGNVMS